MDDLRKNIHALYASGKNKEGLDLIMQEELKGPLKWDLLKAKAVFLGRLGRDEESIKTSDESIALMPGDYFNYNNKGVSLYNLKRYDEAIEAFNKCLSIRPNFALAVQKKVFSLIFSGRFKDAISTYEKSDLPEVLDEIWYNDLGYAYLEAGDCHKAGALLYGAKAINPYEPIYYYNLARLWYKLGDYLRFLKHGSAFILLKLLRKPVKRYSENKIIKRPHISESTLYNNSGRLFLTENEEREFKSILKLLRGPMSTALCNDTWNWFAVNIPYDVFEMNGFEGDIDIILKRPRFLGEHDAGFTYRGFQVKTVIVDKHGHVRSAKRGKKHHGKIKTQLNILKNFGCEQVFFLELFVLERGYTQSNNFPSDEMVREIMNKAEYLKGTGFGYVVFAEEPSPSSDDETGGIGHMPLNMLPAATNKIGPDFSRLVEKLDQFYENASQDKTLNKHSQNFYRFKPTILYCRECTQLTFPVPNLATTEYHCGRCNCKIY